MLIKSAIYILSLLLVNKSSTSSKDIKKILRKEFLSMLFLTLVGLIIASASAYSIIQLASTYHFFIGQFENGIIINLVSFALLSCTGLSLLYYLLVFKPMKATEIQNTQKLQSSGSVQNIAWNFTMGFFEGYNRPRSLKTSLSSLTDL